MSALGDMVGKVREAARRAVARPMAWVTGELERLSPRERRILSIFLAAVAAVVVVGGTFLLLDSAATLQENNADTREALAAIAKHRDEYLEAKKRSAEQEARIGTEPPQLISDIENAAREEQVQIAESSERPTSPAGKRYSEHDVDIKIREVDLQSLSKFLRRLETGPRLVFFTRLAIKKRYSENDKLDVEATATAFERLKETKKKPADKKESDK
jgi:Tfp pilus assembly protein PilO